MRQALVNAGAVRRVDAWSNSGLILDRYIEGYDRPLSEDGEERDPRSDVLSRALSAPPPSVYMDAFHRWEGSLQRIGARSQRFRVTDRLIVGLGSESVLETAITLHRTYGMPLIPGSALKGLARRYFEQELVIGVEDWAVQEFPDATTRPIDGAVCRDLLFGSPRAEASVVFYDAWYVPGTARSRDGQERPLQLDVMTVHHPRYYATSGRTPPTDFDDPNPVTFASAVGDYLVAVSCPAMKWADYALGVLARALQSYGVGGKTSSGYGRLYPVGDGSTTRLRDGGVADPVRGGHSAFAREILSASSSGVKGSLDGWGAIWQRMPDGPEKAEVARAIRQRMAESKVLTDARWMGREWVKSLTSYLETRS